MEWEEIKKLAEERGGKCLSCKSLDERTMAKWECAKGHTGKRRWKR